jgi:hypothetical protein
MYLDVFKIHLWVSQLGIEKFPILGDGSLRNFDFAPNFVAFELTNGLIGGSMQDPHNNELFQCLTPRGVIGILRICVGHGSLHQ